MATAADTIAGMANDVYGDHSSVFEGAFSMLTLPVNTIRSLIALCCLLATLLPAAAQARQLTDEQVREIEFHYSLDKYMVGGCILGAAFSTITGFMTLSGLTVVAAVPYIATGCSLGFLIGGSSLFVYNYFEPAPPLPETNEP